MQERFRVGEAEDVQKTATTHKDFRGRGQIYVQLKRITKNREWWPDMISRLPYVFGLNYLMMIFVAMCDQGLPLNFVLSL